MDYSSSIDTTVGGRDRVDSGTGVDEFATGTIAWSNREIEVRYWSETYVFDVSVTGSVGHGGEYPALAADEDAFELWYAGTRQSGTTWEITPKPDGDGTFVETSDPMEWEGRDLYSGADLTAVAADHFADADLEHLIRRFETRLDEVAGAIEAGGSPGES